MMINFETWKNHFSHEIHKKPEKLQIDANLQVT